MPGKKQKVTRSSASDAGFSGIAAALVGPDEDGQILGDTPVGAAPAGPSQAVADKQSVKAQKYAKKKVQTDSGCLDCEEIFTALKAGLYLCENVSYQQFCQDMADDSYALQLPFNKASEEIEDRKKAQSSLKTRMLPSDVLEATSTGFTVFKDKRGFTPGEFQEEFGKEPSELGYKLQDLISEKGTQYKGVLKDDEGEKKGARYQMYRTYEVRKSDYKMPIENHLFAGQGNNTFKNLTHCASAKRSQEAMMFQKLRNCRLSTADIKQRSAAAGPRGAKSAVGSPSKPDSSPKLGAPSVANTVGGANRKRKSLGDAASSFGDTKAGKYERRTVEEFIALLPFQAALSISNHSRLHYRFANKLLDELQQMNPQPSNYFVLKQHLDRLNIVIDFASKDNSKRPLSDLQVDLAKLSEFVSDWPSNIKDLLLERRMAVLGQIDDQATDEKLKQVIACCVPWRSSTTDGLGDEDAHLFNPLQPTLSTTDGSAMEKASKFRQLVLDKVITPMLANGPSIKERIRHVCVVAMQQFAQKPDSIDEMTLATLFEVMRVLKGLISICDGPGTQYIEQGRQLAQVRKGGGQTLVDNVSAVLHGVAAWKEYLNDVAVSGKRLTQELIDEHADTTNVLHDMLERDVENLGLGVLKKAVTTFKVQGSALRTDLLDKLSKLLTGALDHVASQVARYKVSVASKGKEASDLSVDGVTEAIQQWRELSGGFDLVDSSIPFQTFDAKGPLANIDDVMKFLEQVSDHQRFMAAVTSISDESLPTMTPKRIEDAYDVVVRGSKDMKDAAGAENAGESILKFLQTADGWPHAQAETLIQLAVEICKVERVNKSIVSCATSIHKVWVLRQRRLAYEQLGDSDYSRAQADEAQVMVRGLIVALFEAVRSLTEGQVEYSKDGCIHIETTTVENTVKAASESHLKMCSDKVAAAIGQFKEVVKDVAGADARWTSGLKVKANDVVDIAAVAKLAKKTLLQIDGDALEKGVQDLKALTSNLQKIAETFGFKEGAIELLNEAGEFQRLLRSGALATREAKLVLGHAKFGANEVTWHKFCTKLKKEVGDSTPTIQLEKWMEKYVESVLA
ncbi:unnamed protein product, partial [Prorocentrum cordatum]